MDGVRRLFWLSCWVSWVTLLSVPRVSAQVSWGGWASLPAVPSGPMTQVEVASNQVGRPSLFILGNDGNLYRASQLTTSPGWDSEKWTSWQGSRPAAGTKLVRSFANQDGIGFGRIGVGRNQDGRLEVFAPGSDGRVWHTWQLTPDGSWSDWSAFDNPPNVSWNVADIRVASGADGTLDVLVLNAYNNSLYHQVQAQPNAGWSGVWENLTGQTQQPSDLIVVDTNNGLKHIQTRGADNNLWELSQKGIYDFWGSWQSVNQTLTIDELVDSVQDQTNTAVLVAISANQLFTLSKAPSGTWLPSWQKAGAPANFVGSPTAAARLGDGRLAIFSAVTNGGLWENTQDAARQNWTSWTRVNPDWTPLTNVHRVAAIQTLDSRIEIFVQGKDSLIWRAAERTPPSIVAPPPGTKAAPANILTLTSADGSTFNNPSSVPPTSSVNGKPICSNSTFLSGNDPAYEWTPVISGPQPEITEVGVMGWAFNAHFSDEDFWFAHPFGNDFNYDVVTDSGFSGLIAARGGDDSDRDLATTLANSYYGMNATDALHVEMEQDFIPAFPEYKVQDGDRVGMVGRWIIDCGHGDYHSEIHPPLLVAAARASPSGRVTASIYSRRYLVTQQYGDGAFNKHIYGELGKAGIVPLYQITANSGVLSTPFSGIQTADIILRPSAPPASPFAQLRVDWSIETRPGVTVSMLPSGNDAVQVHVVFDSSAYKAPPIPPHLTTSIPFDELYDEIASHSQSAANGIQILRTLGGLNMSISLQRGVETDRYVQPTPAPLMITSTPASGLAIVKPTSNANAFWPVRGHFEVYWENPVTTTFGGILNRAGGIPVTVAANEKWMDSGIYLRQGEHMQIAATGKWSNTGPPSVGPNGFPNYKFPGTIVPSADLASLVAKVSGSAFYIGSGFSGYSPADGELYFSINDTPSTFDDNEGALNVTVWPN